MRELIGIGFPSVCVTRKPLYKIRTILNQFLYDPTFGNNRSNLTLIHMNMQQMATAVVAKVAVAAAAARGGSAQRMMTAVEQKLQPQHKLFNSRHLQDEIPDDVNTVSIGGTAFFDIDGNGQLDPDQEDGVINPISGTAISVLAELWSCDTGANLGYQRRKRTKNDDGSRAEAATTTQTFQ